MWLRCKPSLVLATRFIRPFTLMFSRSLDFMNRGPKVLYLFACQCQTVTYNVHYFLFCPHSWQSCHCVSPSLNIWTLWPGNRPTATLSFCLLTAWSSFVLLGRGSLIRVMHWQQPLQVFHLFRCSCLKWLMMTSTWPKWKVVMSFPFHHLWGRKLETCHFLAAVLYTTDMPSKLEWSSTVWNRTP
jgi:hypothetical protein